MSVNHVDNVNETAANVDRLMATIVAELRDLRNASLEARRRSASPLKLPSRKSLTTIVEGLSTVLFPNRLGLRQFVHETIDDYVGTHARRRVP